jgi:TIR domain
MGAVFLNYRRGDSEGQARALFVELTKLLGKDSVFMDVDSIALGRDFRTVLQERLGSCDVMVALIGPDWLDAADSSGNRRLDNPTDFVRQEIASALKRNIPVIPVLVQGARMPGSERLPVDLQDLPYRNGFELGHSTWESDVAEMVKRLGLQQQRPSASPPSIQGDKPAQGSAITRTWLLRAAAMTVIIGGAGLLVYFYPQRSAPGTIAAPEPSAGIGAPSAGESPSSGVQAAPAASDGGFAASGLEFNWPGNDCWDIFRGERLVTFQCGANKQALAAGTYTIKGKYAPVFAPFQVTIKNGAATRIEKGGVFTFKWPGGDCWDILRGAQLVTFQCGANQQALEAGSYTIKGKYAPVFSPFEVNIKNGASSRIEKGGVFIFNWPGGDCWDIFRGAQLVMHQCGSNQQALEAGTYTIKGKYAPVFEPFQIKVADGSQVRAP